MSISARLACRAATRCAANISLRPAAVRFAPRHTTPVKLQSLFFTRAQSWQENKNHQKNQDEKPIGTQPPTPPDVTPSRPAEVLHEDIYTVPNILTFTRLAAAPVIGYLVLHDQHAWAVGLFAYAGITDLLDGWIARRWDSKTVVGTVIDPMADKMLMTILTICLAAKGALPIWCAGIILGRDVGLAISAIYYRWISLPPPKTFARYWDFSLPSAEVRPTTISKYNTFLQLALV
jgi:cardiolipin synthase